MIRYYSHQPCTDKCSVGMHVVHTNVPVGIYMVTSVCQHPESGEFVLNRTWFAYDT